MNPDLVRALRASQPDIRERWQACLEEEPVASPLGKPALLTPLFGATLGELFTVLASNSADSAASPSAAEVTAACPCGRSPYLSYFRAGERALVDTLSFLEATTDDDWAVAAQELTAALRRIALRDVEAFCALCQFRRVSLAKAQDSPAPPPAATTTASPAFPPIARHGAPAPSYPSSPASP